MTGKFDRILALKPGWLDGEGEVPKPEIVEKASELIDDLTENEAAQVSVFPTHNGNISLEVQVSERWALEIAPETTDEEMTEAVLELRDMLTSTVDVHTLRQDLDRISAIKPGWFDGEGEAAHSGCVAIAREFLNGLTDQETSGMDVSITVEGNVMYDWLYEERRWMMEITPDGLVVAVIGDPQPTGIKDIDQARNHYRQFLENP